MKYIIFQSENGRRFPVIFPKEFIHVDVGAGMRRALGRTSEWLTPLSAGQVECVAIATFEKSETLSLGSFPI